MFVKTNYFCAISLRDFGCGPAHMTPSGSLSLPDNATSIVRIRISKWNSKDFSMSIVRIDTCAYSLKNCQSFNMLSLNNVTYFSQICPQLRKSRLKTKRKKIDNIDLIQNLSLRFWKTVKSRSRLLKNWSSASWNFPLYNKFILFHLF